MSHPETAVKVTELYEIRSRLIRMRRAVSMNPRMRKEEKIYLYLQLNSLDEIVKPYLQTSIFKTD